MKTIRAIRIQILYWQIDRLMARITRIFLRGQRDKSTEP
jgi:hypothetical protein